MARCWASRYGRAGILGMLAISALLLYIVTRSDILPSADDSIYIVTAKALASGEGYRHSGVAGLPPARQYPLVYPVLLSLVWRLWPAYPDNLGLMQILSGVAGALAILAGYAYLVRSGLATRGLALLAVTLAAVNPIWVWLATIVWSEMFYTLLSFVTLYAAGRWDEKTEGSLRWQRAAWATASLAGVALAPLTRYLGVALVAGLVLHFCWRRAWAKAVAVLGVSVAAFGPWWLWVRLSGGSPYSANVHAGIAVLTTGVTNLVDALVYGVPYHIVPLLPYYAVSRIELGAGGLGGTLLTALRLVVLALVLIGFARTWRDRPDPAHGYLAVYVLLLASYGLDAYRTYMHRYLTPLAPFLLVWFFLGLQRAAEHLVLWLSALGSRLSARSLSKWAAVCAVGLSFLGSAQRDGVMVYNAVSTGNVFGAQDATRERLCREAANWVLTQIPPAARVASDWAPYLHLATGRTIAAVTPLGAEPTTPQRVWEAIAAGRPNYVVAFGQADLAAAIEAHPGDLEPVMRNRCATTYRVAIRTWDGKG